MTQLELPLDMSGQMSYRHGTIGDLLEREDVYTMKTDGAPVPVVHATEILTDGTIKEHVLTGQDVSEMFRLRGFDKSRMDSLNQQVNGYNKTVQDLETNIQGWIESEADSEEIIRDLCHMFNIEPMHTIEWSAVMSVRGSVQIPYYEVSSFDLHSHLADELYVDRNDYNIDVYEYDVDAAEEE